MTTSILALALAYVFLLFLLLLALLKSELAPGLKLVLAAFCLGFYLWHYEALQDYLGWPAADGIPAHFELISSITVEPDVKNDEPGAIYIWVRDLEASRSIPRAFRLAYRRETHRQVEDTLQQQRRGERFVGSPVAGGAGERTRLEFDAVERDTGSHKSSLQP